MESGNCEAVYADSVPPLRIRGTEHLQRCCGDGHEHPEGTVLRKVALLEEKSTKLLLILSPEIYLHCLTFERPGLDGRAPEYARRKTDELISINFGEGFRGVDRIVLELQERSRARESLVDFETPLAAEAITCRPSFSELVQPVLTFGAE